MPGTASNNGGDSVTFRIDPTLKAELSRLAKRNRTSLGSLLRDMARDRVAVEKRRSFEAEARRQSLAAAKAAQNAGSDEHAVMQELDGDLEDFSVEWK